MVAAAYVSAPTAPSQPHAERQWSGQSVKGAAQHIVRHGSDWSPRGPPLLCSDLSHRRSPANLSLAGSPARAGLLLLLAAVVVELTVEDEDEAAALVAG